MKTRKIKAFSLIELIIVSSILIIVSTSGVFYFTDFIEDLAFKKTLNDVKNNFETLDNKISKKEIFDYEIYLSGGTNYYISRENIFDLDTTIKFNKLENGTGSFSFDNPSSGTGTIKYYENYKFKKSEEVVYDGSFTGNFINPSIYKITGTFSGDTLNTINFNYFDNKKLIKLIKIDTNNGLNLDSIKIKNILGKKEFGNNNLNEKVVLTFEDNNGKTETLEIKK